MLVGAGHFCCNKRVENVFAHGGADNFVEMKPGAV